MKLSLLATLTLLLPAQLLAQGMRLNLWTTSAVPPLTLTNESFVASGLDTNKIVISGAGTVGANGSYKWSGARFTNGIYNITYNAGDGLNYLSNTTQILYATPDVGIIEPAWDFGSGAAPAPASIYGPITNVFRSLTGYPPSLPVIGTNIYVDALTGNDTNAVVGRMDRPWRNLDVALLAARSGQMVKIGPGNYPGTAFYATNGVNIEGSGIGSTIIGAPGIERKIYLRANCRLANLTSYAFVQLGLAGLSRATNVIIENCWIDSTVDGIYLDWWGAPVVVQNCPFIGSSFDAVADWDITPTTSDRVIKFKNCEIVTYGTNGFWQLACLSGASSRYEFYGCSLIASNGVAGNFCIWMAGTQFRTNLTGSVLLSSTTLTSVTTNGGDAKTICVSNAQPITIVGGAVPTSQFGLNVVVNTNVPTVFHGTNTPESRIVGAIGSTYLRLDGGAVTSFYIKTNGTGNTGWSGR